MTKTLNWGTQVGRKSTLEISSNPYFTNDLALRPCFNILKGKEMEENKRWEGW